MTTNWQTRMATLSSVVGMVVSVSRETHRAARQRQLRPIRLTAADREACLDALAEQYAVGRIDDAELDRRVDLAHRAVVHGALDPVFAGLPRPVFDAPRYSRSTASGSRPRWRRPGGWRWLVFVATAWVAVPFVLIGMLFLAAGHEAAAMVFGVPPLMGVVVLWRWATGRQPSARPRSWAGPRV